MQNWYRKLLSELCCSYRQGREEAILFRQPIVFHMGLPIGGPFCSWDAAEECAVWRDCEEQTDSRRIVTSRRCRRG